MQCLLASVPCSKRSWYFPGANRDVCVYPCRPRFSKPVSQACATRLSSVSHQLSRQQVHHHPAPPDIYPPGFGDRSIRREFVINWITWSGVGLGLVSNSKRLKLASRGGPGHLLIRERRHVLRSVACSAVSSHSH